MIEKQLCRILGSRQKNLIMPLPLTPEEKKKEQSKADNGESGDINGKDDGELSSPPKFTPEEETACINRPLSIYLLHYILRGHELTVRHNHRAC
jgi:hypothetical protein